MATSRVKSIYINPYMHTLYDALLIDSPFKKLCD